MDRKKVDQKIVKKKKEIYRGKATTQGIPEKVLDRFVTGKLEKFYQETCLLEQSFVKDPNKSVKDLLREKIAKLGENMSIKRFSRFHLGVE